MLLATALLVGTASIGPVAGAEGIGNDDPVSLVYVTGARVVDVRNTNGTLTRIYSIPVGSAFRTEGGGRPCRFAATTTGVTSDGRRYTPGQLVVSEHWIFLEGTAPSFGEPTPVDPTAGTRPLAVAVRHFIAFCDSTAHPIAQLTVRASDPLLDPRRRLVTLYDQLRLIRPVVYTNPVVVRWGGLVTRYPAWLAIDPRAWRAQRSPAVEWRGWRMYLLARPMRLDFVVRFRPDPTRPSPAFDGVVPCIDGRVVVRVSAVAVPAMPTLPAQTAPGVNGPCMWTPPGPGSVTVQARITYDVTFWANAYVEAQPPYGWSSLPITFATGELAAVNVLGR